MKNHIILTAALMLCLCHLQGQPRPGVTASLEEKFTKEFGTAGNVHWGQAEGVTFAQFMYQNQFWLAYYDKEETLIATARKINTPQHLPILVKRSLDDFRDQRAPAAMPGPVFELIRDGIAQYVVILDSKEMTYVLKFDNSGNRTTLDKVRHNATGESADQRGLIARRIRP